MPYFKTTELWELPQMRAVTQLDKAIAAREAQAAIVGKEYHVGARIIRVLENIATEELDSPTGDLLEELSVRQSVGLPNFTNAMGNLNSLFVIMYSIDQLTLFGLRLVSHATVFEAHKPLAGSSRRGATPHPILDALDETPITTVANYLDILHKHIGGTATAAFSKRRMAGPIRVRDILNDTGLLPRIELLRAPRMASYTPNPNSYPVFGPGIIPALTAAALRHIYGELPILFINYDTDNLTFFHAYEDIEYSDTGYRTGIPYIYMTNERGPFLDTVLRLEDIDAIKENYVVVSVRTAVNTPKIPAQRLTPLVIAGNTHKLVLKSFVVGCSDQQGTNHEAAGFIENGVVSYIDDSRKFTFSADDAALLSMILNYATTLVYQKMPIYLTSRS